MHYKFHCEELCMLKKHCSAHYQMPTSIFMPKYGFVFILKMYRPTKHPSIHTLDLNVLFAYSLCSCLPLVAGPRKNVLLPFIRCMCAESQGTSAWKGSQKISTPSSCSQQGSQGIRPGCSSLCPVGSSKLPSIWTACHKQSSF